MIDSDKQALLNGSATVQTEIEIINEDNDNVILTEDNCVIDWNYEDFRQVKDEGFIGQFVARQLTGNLKNLGEDFKITDKELQLRLGIRTNDNTNWYSLGNFIVTKVTDDEVLDKTNFESLDYTKKFNKTYEDTITYPCTALELAQNVCEQCDVELGSVSFKNSNYIITGNPFTNGESCRDVMKAIGKLAFSWVRVDWDNKVYIDFDPTPFTSETIPSEYNVIGNNKYYKLETQKEKFGVVNRIVIGYSNIEGEKTKIEDAQSIQENGLCEITVFDNPLVYTQTQRESIINSASDLLGFAYTPLNTLTVGHPWLKGNELVRVNDMEGVSHDTIPLDRTIQYFGHIKTLINSSTQTKTNTEYAYTPEMTKQLARTEIMVDKQNQTITSVVNTVTEQNDKISTIEQTVDQIESQITDIPTITTENEGTGNVYLANLMSMKLISLRIHPTDRDIIGLFASHLLTVKEGLKALSRGVTFDNTNSIEKDLYYKLPDNLYYYDDDIYDEFFYDGKEERIYVVRKVEVDELGNKSVLETPITEEYEYQDIIVEEGNYNVFMSTYPTAYIYIKAMIKNDYTDMFATSYEVDSKITQTANEINLEVNKKVNDEDLTGANIMLRINNDESEAQINADKISLTGKTINMTSDNIAINSTNFNVDKDGNVNALSLTTGDSVNIGVNQSSSGTDVKYIKMSDITNLKRTRNTQYNYDELEIDSTNIRINAGTIGDHGRGTVFYSDGYYTEIHNYFGNGQYIALDSGYIHSSSDVIPDSDERLKQNIEDLDISFIDDLKVKKYQYKRSPEFEQIGLVAQDYIDKDYSKYFVVQHKDGYYGINYNNINSALIQYCQEMKKEINSLKEEIKQLKESDK